MRIKKRWKRLATWAELYGHANTVYTTIGLLLGGAIAVPTVISGIAHDLAWPYLSLAVLLIVAIVAWSVRQLFLLFGAPLNIRSRPDFAYCLAYTGVAIGYDNDAVEIGIGLLNASTWPLSYEVQSFSVIVGDRTIRNPQFLNNGGLVPRIVGRTYWYPPFDRAQLPTGKHDAEIKFEIAYGPPKGELMRVLKMQIGLKLEVLENEIKKADRILSEHDVVFHAEN